jgi:hypothetical protein
VGSDGAAAAGGSVVSDGPAASGEFAADGTRAVAPRDRDVAATARAAIDAMRRGVVAYSVLAD